MIGLEDAPDIDGSLQSGLALAKRSHDSRLASLLRLGSDPLLRNGHALMASTLISSVLGMAFWVVSARGYSPAVVGRNSVALNALTFVGVGAQLGLANGLIRFLPVAGTKTLRLVVLTYLVCGAVAVLGAVLVFFFLPRLVPSLSYLATSPALFLWWVLATTTWTAFVLEDGILTGLRLARWVPLENAGFALVKVALVLPLASLLPRTGIFFAWTLAVVVTVIPTNLYLFTRAIPRAGAAGGPSEVSKRQLANYVPYDYLSSLVFAFAISIVPVLVIRQKGAAESAYFNLSWVMAYVLYLASMNLGSSFIVENSADPARLSAQSRRVLAHLLKLLVPVVIVLCLGSRTILELFGARYAAGGTWTLRLLVLSALPFALNNTVLCALRVQRRVRTCLCIEVPLCLLAVGLSWALLEPFGITGVGLAWLSAQSLVAIVLVGLWPRLVPARSGAKACVALASSTQLLRPVSLATPALRPLRRSGLWPLRSGATRLSRSRRRELQHVLSPDRRRARSLPLEVPRVTACRSSFDTADAAWIVRGPVRIGRAVIVRHAEEKNELHADLERRGELRGDARLRGFGHLVPELKVASHLGYEVAMEATHDCVSGAELLTMAPWSATRMTRGAHGAIGLLHGATRCESSLCGDTLEKLLASRLSSIESFLGTGRRASVRLQATMRLGGALWRALSGRGLPLCTVHGHLRADALLVSPESLRIIGVSEWGRSSAKELASVDHLSLALDVHRRERGARPGETVARALRTRRLPEGPVFALAARAVDDLGADPVDLLLWTWLAAVAHELEREPSRASTSTFWLAEFAPVLAEFS